MAQFRKMNEKGEWVHFDPPPAHEASTLMFDATVSAIALYVVLAAVGVALSVWVFGVEFESAAGFALVLLMAAVVLGVLLAIIIFIIKEAILWPWAKSKKVFAYFKVGARRKTLKK